MNKPRFVPIRILLGFIAAYHLIAGVAATFFQDAAVKIGSLFFGVQIAMEPQAELLVRYLGAFGIAFGIMAVLAAVSPERNRTFIYGAIVYFIVRAFDRIAFAGLLAQHSTGGVPNWWRILVILVFAVGLLVLLPRTKSASSAAAPA